MKLSFFLNIVLIVFLEIAITGVFFYMFIIFTNKAKATVVATPAQITSSVPANKTYLQAVAMCGSTGIFDLTWKDFNAGKIQSIYCK